MSGNDNPVQAFLHCCTSVAHSLHSHLSFLFLSPNSPSSKRSPSQDAKLILPTVSLRESIQKPVEAPLTKEELGRATWTLLHTIAAQFPDNPTRQQKHDVKELMAILSRIYPCKECADHFKDVLNVFLQGIALQFSAAVS